MRDRSHPVLFLAGSFVITVTLLFGSQLAPAYFSGADERDQSSMRLADATGAESHWAPLAVALHGRHLRKFDAITPDGASCPGANASPLGPTVDSQSSANVLEGNSSTAPPSNGTGPSTGLACPPTGGDARTDVSRGPSLRNPNR